MGPGMIKLLIADDHTLFREAIVQYIERAEPDMEAIVASDLHGVMLALEEGENPDLVLLDLKMPGMNGLQGIEKLSEEYPDILVALMSGVAEKKDIKEALEIGVCGYFPKTMSGRAMMNAIKEVLAGKPYIPKDHNTDDFLPSYYGSSIKKNVLPKERDISLTPREQEVLSFLMDGAANKEIARALDLQVVTVKLHVRGICKKLGAKNRTQAALIATELGLAEKIAR